MADSLEFIQRQIKFAKEGKFGSKSTDILNKYQGKLNKLTGGSTAPSNEPKYNASNPNDLAFNAVKGALSFGNSIAGAFGMGLPSGLAKSQNDAITSAYNQATQPNTAAQAPVVDPYEEALTKYREQIEALSMETDPDYNENLEQLSPEELEEEIL